MRPKNYLNNKDILKEIHRSKVTFSSYVDKERDHQYDMIVKTIDDIESEYTIKHPVLDDEGEPVLTATGREKFTIEKRTVLQDAIEARAKRIGQTAFDEHKKAGGIQKLAEFKVDPATIVKTDVVFRVMTYDHIPEEPGRKKNPKTVADTKIKLNFPPFQHFRYTEDDELICVGKSHWKGPVDTGKFCKDKGQATETLARMWLKLCEKYGTRGNVRGYTYNDEMQGQAILQLAQIGLQFDESKSDNPFAYYTAAVKHSFVRVINIEKRVQVIRDDILEMNDMTPSYTRQQQGEWELDMRRAEENKDND